jgi:hypothetical protein
LSVHGVHEHEYTTPPESSSKAGKSKDSSSTSGAEPTSADGKGAADKAIKEARVSGSLDTKGKGRDTGEGTSKTSAKRESPDTGEGPPAKKARTGGPPVGTQKERVFKSGLEAKNHERTEPAYAGDITGTGNDYDLINRMQHHEDWKIQGKIRTDKHPEGLGPKEQGTSRNHILSDHKLAAILQETASHPKDSSHHAAVNQFLSTVAGPEKGAEAYRKYDDALQFKQKAQNESDPKTKAEHEAKAHKHLEDAINTASNSPANLRIGDARANSQIGQGGDYELKYGRMTGRSKDIFKAIHELGRSGAISRRTRFRAASPIIVADGTKTGPGKGDWKYKNAGYISSDTPKPSRTSKSSPSTKSETPKPAGSSESSPSGTSGASKPSAQKPFPSVQRRYPMDEDFFTPKEPKEKDRPNEAPY